MEITKTKISQLPPEQLRWLSSIKNLFEIPFYKDSIKSKELIGAIQLKAKENGYLEIGSVLDSDDLKEYFKG